MEDKDDIRISGHLQGKKKCIQRYNEGNFTERRKNRNCN